MHSLDYFDLGMPVSDSMETVAIEIDGQVLDVSAGISVMRAAVFVRKRIPKLCATDTLKSFGSCRLCLVEIEGCKGYPVSCMTQIVAGMKIKTESLALAKLRRGVMEFYLSDHPQQYVSDEVFVCTEFKAMAKLVGLQHNCYGVDGECYAGLPFDDSNPYFRFDLSACIVCSRCVCACDEVQGTFALTIEGCGFDS